MRLAYRKLLRILINIEMYVNEKPVFRFIKQMGTSVRLLQLMIMGYPRFQAFKSRSIF